MSWVLFDLDPVGVPRFCMTAPLDVTVLVDYLIFHLQKSEKIILNKIEKEKKSVTWMHFLKRIN